MNRSKFSFNAVLAVIAVFSAIILFVGITMVDMATILPVEDEYRIEDTDYFIRYSSFRPYGLYRWSELLCEGSFGYDWGACYTGDVLYCNEYKTTDFGLMAINVVKIDMTTYKKETLYRDAMIRGRCASGELVIFKGYVSPSWSPDVNPLRSVFAASDGDILPESDGATVCWFDTEKGTIVHSVKDPMAMSKGKENYYLSASLEEVKG